MDKFVYVLTLEWDYYDGDDLNHKIIGIFDSFKKAYNEYQKRLEKYNEVNKPFEIDCDIYFKQNTDSLKHTIYNRVDKEYTGYIIEKIKVE